MTKKGLLFTLLPFWLFVFLFKFAAGLHYTLLPILGERVMPIWIVGLVIGAASLLQLFFDVPAGFLLDRFGYVRVMRASTAVFLLGASILIFHFSIYVYLATVFLGFIGWLFYGPGINAYALSKAPREEGGRYMGMQHVFASLGIVCATLLLVFMADSTTTTIGVTVSIIFIAALVALASTRDDRVSLSEMQARHAHHSYYLRRKLIHKLFEVIKRLDPASSILALQNLAGSIFYGMIWFTIPLVIVTQKNSGVLGVGLSVFDLAVVLLGAFLGKLADRHRKKTLIFMGLLVFSVTGIFLGFNLNIIFLLLGFLATAGEEMSSASLWSWLERLDTDHKDDGLINGAIVLFEDIGWTIGPIIAGFLFGFLGPSFTIMIGAIPILAVWIFALFFLRHREDPVPVAALGYSRKPIRRRHKG